MRISRLVTLFHLQTSQLVQLSTTSSFNQVKVLNLSVPLVLLLKFWVKKVNTYLFVFNQVKFVWFLVHVVQLSVL